MRVGVGYDVHRLVEGRRLVLGGVEIPFEKGLDGHSDADCLLHAVADALLGAAGLGDIGAHFPDSDPAYKGMSSRRILTSVVQKVKEKGFVVNNVDSVIAAQRPRLAQHIPRMRDNIAHDAGVGPDRVNVKATTTEGLGPEGRGEGIACWASCTLSESKNQE